MGSCELTWEEVKYSVADTEITRLQGKSRTVRAAVKLRSVQILPLGRIRGKNSCKLWEIIQNKLVYPSCSRVYNNLTIIFSSFSPLKFSPAGPFKSSIDGEPDPFSPMSPPTAAAPVSAPKENGAASQPIKTPARNKKLKGHRRWGGAPPRTSLGQINTSWSVVVFL